MMSGIKSNSHPHKSAQVENRQQQELQRILMHLSKLEASEQICLEAQTLRDFLQTAAFDKLDWMQELSLNNENSTPFEQLIYLSLLMQNEEWIDNALEKVISFLPLKKLNWNAKHASHHADATFLMILVHFATIEKKWAQVVLERIYTSKKLDWISPQTMFKGESPLSRLVDFALMGQSFAQGALMRMSSHLPLHKLDWNKKSFYSNKRILGMLNSLYFHSGWAVPVFSRLLDTIDFSMINWNEEIPSNASSTTLWANLVMIGKNNALLQPSLLKIVREASIGFFDWNGETLEKLTILNSLLNRALLDDVESTQETWVQEMLIEAFKKIKSEQIKWEKSGSVDQTSLLWKLSRCAVLGQSWAMRMLEEVLLGEIIPLVSLQTELHSEPYGGHHFLGMLAILATQQGKENLFLHLLMIPSITLDLELKIGKETIIDYLLNQGKPEWVTLLYLKYRALIRQDNHSKSTQQFFIDIEKVLSETQEKIAHFKDVIVHKIEFPEEIVDLFVINILQSAFEEKFGAYIDIGKSVLQVLMFSESFTTELIAKKNTEAFKQLEEMDDKFADELGEQSYQCLAIQGNKHYDLLGNNSSEPSTSENHSRMLGILQNFKRLTLNTVSNLYRSSFGLSPDIHRYCPRWEGVIYESLLELRAKQKLPVHLNREQRQRIIDEIATWEKQLSKKEIKKKIRFLIQ